MADSCADGDEDSRDSLSNEEETIQGNLPGTGQVPKQSLKQDPQGWDCECAAIRAFFCFLILCVVILQSYLDYREFQAPKFVLRILGGVKHASHFPGQIELGGRQNRGNLSCRMATDNSDLVKVRQDGHVAFVVGYTGETGKELIKALSVMKPFSRVLLIGRRKTNVTEKLGNEFEEKIVDFDRLEEHENVFAGCDIGFNCLGTTRGKSGKDGFIRVDHDYVIKTAELAKAKGCKHFLHVSSMGSNQTSWFFYTKTKGLVEEELQNLQFEHLSIFRPGSLLCDREDSRIGEKFAACCLSPCICCCSKYLAIPTETLALAMVRRACQPNGAVEIIENKTIHYIAG
ncbi:oxidoreductase HTATIP2-like [Ostrea edulis]|uniref:oxidoreductase HTATIP2-like n=1 Tax=Ostrea edulis TaxID=37623 RepID=UPI002096394A|nr:oxidoreductase HTATIP2-like [Ostrea edulis]